VDIQLQMTELGYPPGMELHVFDFWSGAYQRASEPGLVFEGVPSHGCKLLRVCQVGESPQLVGDTLHISMGIEINSTLMKGEKLIIETQDMGRRVEGEVWLWLDEKPKEVNCNGERTSIEAKGMGVYALKVRFTDRGKVNIIL
jgi:hypothetical protein